MNDYEVGFYTAKFKDFIERIQNRIPYRKRDPMYKQEVFNFCMRLQQLICHKQRELDLQVINPQYVTKIGQQIPFTIMADPQVLGAIDLGEEYIVNIVRFFATEFNTIITDIDLGTTYANGVQIWLRVDVYPYTLFQSEGFKFEDVAKEF